MARAKAAKKKQFGLLEGKKVAAALNGLKWKVSIAGGVSTKGENVEILEPQHFECQALDAILDAAQGDKVTTGEKLGSKENRFLRPVQKDKNASQVYWAIGALGAALWAQDTSLATLVGLATASTCIAVHTKTQGSHGLHLRTSKEELRFDEAKQVRERNPRRCGL